MQQLEKQNLDTSLEWMTLFQTNARWPHLLIFLKNPKNQNYPKKILKINKILASHSYIS